MLIPSSPAPGLNNDASTFAAAGGWATKTTSKLGEDRQGTAGTAVWRPRGGSTSLGE